VTSASSGPNASPDPSRWAWAARPRGVLLLLLGWALFHALLRVALSSTLTADDAREAVLAQALRWGYQARQPPLYNWLVWGAFRLLGPGLLPLTLLKYAGLVLAFWLVYRTARRILIDPRLAALGTFSFLLIVPISWNIHEALTHSVAVLAACAATIYATIRLGDAPTRRAYVTLGLAAGLGLLSKFTFGLFLAALVLAALCADPYRHRFRNPAILIAALVAALLVLPFAVWVLREGHDLGQLYAREVRIEESDPWSEQARTGLGYIARLGAAYLAPIGVALAACFPAIYRRLPRDARGHPGGRLVGWLLFWMLGLLVGAALAGGLGLLKARWLIPAFFLVPLYGLWRLDRHGGPRARVTAFAVVLLIAEVAVVGALGVRVLGASWFRRPYAMNEPSDTVAAELVRAGFTRGTIVAGFGTLAGNLAVRFPDSRVLHTEYPEFVPRPEGAGQCLLVWDRHRQARAAPGTDAGIRLPEDVERLATRLDASLAGTERVGVVEATFRHDQRHVRRVDYVLVPEGVGRCR
jgi:4-amino-4-deoxy-L-arabinose transferase-like glycosyltransferase